MTQEEKHALIAEKIEGMRCVTYDDAVHEMVPAQFDPDKLYSFGWVSTAKVIYFVLPSYCCDLNLCARTEAKIAEMGLDGEYIQCLRRVVWRDDPRNPEFAVATAPASARVDAMVALIHQTVKEER